MADEDEDVTIELELRDALSSSAAVAAHEMEQLADNTKQANRQLLLLDKRANKAADALFRLAAAAKAASGSQAQLNYHMNTGAKTFTSYTKATASSNKPMQQHNRNTTQATRNTKMFSRVLGIAAVGAKFFGLAIAGAGAALGAAGLASQALMAVSSVSSLVVALSSLLSFAALLPTALGAVAVSAIALMVAFKGTGEAFKAAFTGDIDALNEALKGMGPNAQAFFKEIYAFKDEFKDFKKVIQESMFAPLKGLVTPAIKTMFGTFKTELASVAGEWGKFFAEFLKFFSTGKSVGLFKDLSQGAREFIAAITSGIGPLLNGLASVVQTVKPYWTDFMKVVGTTFQMFGDWLKRIAEDGTLKGWIERAIVTFGQLTNIVMNISGIFSNIFGGGATEGTHLLAMLDGIIMKVRQFTDSVEGQQAIINFFSALGAISAATTPIFGILANFIGNVLAPTLAEVVTNLAPGFTIFLQALSDGLAAIAPYLPQLATAFSMLLTALAPLLPILGQVIGILVGEFAAIIQAIAPTIGVFAQAFSALLTPALAVASSWLEIILPIIVQFGLMFAQALMPLIPMFGELAMMLLPVFLQFLAQMAGLLPTLVPLVAQWAETFTSNLISAFAMMMPYLPQIIEAFLQIYMAIIQNLPTLIQLSISFMNLGTAILPLIPTIMSFIVTILQIIAASISTGAAVAGMAISIVSAIVNMVSGVASKVAIIATVLAAPFQTAYNIILGVINSITGAIQGLAGQVQGVMNKIASIDVNPFRAFGGDVAMGTTYTVGEIGPELFVPNVGTPELIGKDGMTSFTPSSAGYVVPSYVLDALNAMESKMAGTVSDSPSHAESTALMAALAASKEEHHTHYHASVTTGDVRSEDDIVKIEKAVDRAIKRAKREEEERR